MKKSFCLLFVFLFIMGSVVSVTGASGTQYVADAMRVKYQNPYNSGICYEFSIPKVMLNSKDADEVNAELLAEYKPWLDNIEEEWTAIDLDYAYYCDNGVLSVITIFRYFMITKYHIYNFDVANGDLLETEEMCLRFNKSYDRIIEDVKIAIEKACIQYSNSVNDKNYISMILERSLSEENLDAIRVYLEDGRLYVKYRYYVPAGSEYEYKTIDITDNYELEESVILGDSNSDGKVNVKDATWVQKVVAGLVSLSERGKLLADVDGNSKINVKDATAIQKYVAGIETGFLIGELIM